MSSSQLSYFSEGLKPPTSSPFYFGTIGFPKHYYADWWFGTFLCYLSIGNNNIQ